MAGRARLACVAAVLGLVATPPVLGQALLDVAPAAGQPRPPQQTWTLTLGVLGAVAPVYEGSDSYRAFPAPVFDLRYRDLAFASVRDGIGLNLVRREWLTLGPVVRFRPGRDQDDNRALRGLGDVGPTVEAGVLATLGDGPVKLRLEAAQGVNGGGHRGFQARADLTYARPITERLILSGGPSITFADRTFTQSYFGITPDQAARSGYRAYDAEGGFKDVGFGLNATYRLGRGFALIAIAEVKQLIGDAADSPIVRDETQGFFGLGLTWRGGL